MIASRWQTKPPLGYRLDRDHPLAQGLVSFWSLNEGTGTPNDSVTPRKITLGTFSSAPVWTADPAGMVYSTNYPPNPGGGAGRNVFTFGTCPDLATSNGLFSLVWGGRHTVLAQSQVLLNLYDPSTTAQLYVGLAGTAGEMFLTSSNGTSSGNTTTPLILDTNRHAYGLTLSSSATGGLSLYRDGLNVGSATVAHPPFLTTATTGWLFCSYSTTSNPAQPIQGLWSYVGLYYRPLSGSEHAAIAANPWQIFEPRRTTVSTYLGIPDFTVSPTSIPAGRSTPTALALVGQPSVNWVSGTTTFTDSGVAGTSISSQSITDATHATVNVATGSTAGTLTLTDNNGNRGTVQVVTPVITASPTSIPANHPGQITISLTANIGVWTPGSTSTFSLVSPPAGVTLVSQSVTSSTAASIVVTTGTGTGPLVISDGFETTTVQIGTPTLAITPASITVGGSYSLTATGTFTVWTHETASTLFSLAGGTGASITGIVVHTDTSATIALSAGSATGPLTVTDTSTTATAPVAVASPPSGSLHITGPLTFQHTGGTVGTFGGKNAAAIAFDFQADSNAGINLAAGIPIVDFATKPSGAAPLAAFTPALAGGTSTLQFNLYGTSGGSTELFTTTVPIELGVGYRFLLTASVGTPSGTFTAATLNGSSYIGLTAGTLQVGDAISGSGIPSGAFVMGSCGPNVYQIGTYVNNALQPANATATASGVALTVTRGTQTLYVNGLSYATGNVPFPTFAYSGFVFGANAGTDGNGNAVATDLQVSNVALWG